MCPFNGQPGDSARPIAPVEYEFFKRTNAVSGRCQPDPMRQIHLRSRPQRATLYRASLPSGHDFHRLSNHRSPFSRAPGGELCYYFVGLLRRSQCRKRSLSAQLHCSAAFCVQLHSRFTSRPKDVYRCPRTVPQPMVSIAGPIGAPIGATITTGHIAVVAATIQRTSGSATADFGGTTDTLTRRGGRSEGASLLSSTERGLQIRAHFDVVSFRRQRQFAVHTHSV